MEREGRFDVDAGDRRPFALMLDDDRATAEMYRLGLEFAGFRAAVTTHAAELYAALEEELPDILVLDWQLGQLTGADVLERLRADWRTARLPVLMLSNFSSDLDGAVDRVFAYGALAWLTKSSTPPKLLAERLWESLQWRGAESLPG